MTPAQAAQGSAPTTGIEHRAQRRYLRVFASREITLLLEHAAVDVLLVAKTRKEPGPSLAIRCPKCGADGVSAAAYRQVDDLCAFHFLKLLTIRNTFVECSACRAKLRSSIDLDELGAYRHGELNQFLSHDVSFVVKFLTVASLVLCIAPIVGAVLALLAVLLTLKSIGWTRTVSRVALVLSTLITSFFMIALLLGK